MTTSQQLEFRTNNEILVLDGRVVEYFREGIDGSMRFHVEHLAIGTKDHDGGLKVRFGHGRGGATILNGGKMKVPAELVPQFNAFVEAAIAARSTE